MFFVAEIGSNWEGDVLKAFHLIYACKMAGANAVKFQMWRANDLYDGKYKEYELTFDKAKEIKEYCDDIDIEFFCSVFYPEAVDFLEELGVKRYKLASRTLTLKDPNSFQTISKMCDILNKPIIFSNGFKTAIHPQTWDDDFIELYCIPEYPANPHDINWEIALKCHGFSDHTLGIESALKYARLKPDCIIEKHVKLEDTNSPDSFFSITTQELAQLITLSTS